jgi:hypothetical protein
LSFFFFFFRVPFKEHVINTQKQTRKNLDSSTAPSSFDLQFTV